MTPTSIQIVEVGKKENIISYECSINDQDSITYLNHLDPATIIKVSLAVNYKNDYSTEAVFKTTVSFTTKDIAFKTNLPKVISVGNVIVEAESNIDDSEENVGFEWLRTDWTDEFPSNEGKAYLYEGTMEGYIRNLHTEKL